MNTYVSLTVIRAGEEKPIIFSIKREKLDIPDVEYNEIVPNIFHINIHQFGDSATATFEDIVQKLLVKNPNGIILDLRQDGGGYLQSAVDILSEFVSKKEIAAIIKYRDQSQNTTLYTKESGKLAKIPVVVLIDEGSASASEIVAGAFQDWGRAVVVGTQSYGKGSVQEVETLQNGASLRVTIAHWFTPKDRTIQGVGITPDKIIEFKKDGYKDGMDSQLELAIKILTNKL